MRRWKKNIRYLKNLPNHADSYLRGVDRHGSSVLCGKIPKRTRFKISMEEKTITASGEWNKYQISLESNIEQIYWFN